MVKPNNVELDFRDGGISFGFKLLRLHSDMAIIERYCLKNSGIIDDTIAPKIFRLVDQASALAEETRGWIDENGK